MINPYTPPTTPIENDRCDCPICGNRVGFYRFFIPGRHCLHCGNYLTVRNWTSPRWPWGAAIILIIAMPFVMRMFQINVSAGVALTLLFHVAISRWIYNYFAGRLVPAVCWGVFALPDDDRLHR